MNTTIRTLKEFTGTEIRIMIEETIKKTEKGDIVIKLVLQQEEEITIVQREEEITIVQEDVIANHLTIMARETAIIIDFHADFGMSEDGALMLTQTITKSELTVSNMQSLI